MKDCKLGILNERSPRIRDGDLGVVAGEELDPTSLFQLV
jgi:hypothetical protein